MPDQRITDGDIGGGHGVEVYGGGRPVPSETPKVDTTTACMGMSPKVTGLGYTPPSGIQCELPVDKKLMPEFDK